MTWYFPFQCSVWCFSSQAVRIIVLQVSDASSDSIFQMYFNLTASLHDSSNIWRVVSRTDSSLIMISEEWISFPKRHRLRSKNLQEKNSRDQTLLETLSFTTQDRDICRFCDSLGHVRAYVRTLWIFVSSTKWVYFNLHFTDVLSHEHVNIFVYNVRKSESK